MKKTLNTERVQRTLHQIRKRYWYHIIAILLIVLGLGLFGLARSPHAHASTLANTLYVTNYGATPNDNQDDTAGIQAALNAATAGDTVVMPSGAYIISSQLTIPTSGIILRGDCTGCTILKFVGGSSTNAENAIIRIAGKNNVEVVNATLDGNLSGNIQFGIQAESSDALYLHQLAIRNFAPVNDPNKSFAPMGIYFSNAVSDSTVEDNTITNIGINATWGSGIRFVDGSSRNRILYNTVDTTGRGGIFCSGNPDGGDTAISADDLIRYNIVRNSGVPNPGSRGIGLGIEAWGRCDRIVIEDNRVDHWISDGVPYTAVRRNIVGNQGNSETDQSKDTAFLGLEGGGPNNVYTDNVVDGGAQIGFEGGTGPEKYMDFSHNILNHSVQWGVQLFGDQDVIDSGQYFYHNQYINTYRGLSYAAYPGADGHGFRIQKQSNHITLDGDVFDHNGGYGLQIDDPPSVDQLSIINSTFTNNGLAAVSPYTGYHDLEWQNNTVSGNGTDNTLTPTGFSDQPPVASFSIPSTAALGQSVQFTDQSSDPDGSIAHVLWNFGEGVPSTDTNPSFIYQQPGHYRVGLTVWDNAGRGAHSEQWITVTAPFSSSFESGDVQPTWTNTVDNAGYPAGGIAAVGGICCGLTGPEAGVRNEVAHTGTSALMYSGSATNSSGPDYAYEQVFDLSSQAVTMGANTVLSYWIYPQSSTQMAQVSGSNSSCVAIDLIFSDGSNLRDSGAVDQHNNRAHPAFQCNHLLLDTWNYVTINLGDHSNGKQVVRVDVGYDQPNGTGGYRGYIDDINIYS